MCDERSKIMTFPKIKFMTKAQTKILNISDIMENNRPAPVKPPKSGNASRASPELTVLTGNQSSGFPKPREPLPSFQDGRSKPESSGNNAKGNPLTPDSGDSYKNMNATLGFDTSSNNWVDLMDKEAKEKSQVEDAGALDASALDSSIEEVPTSPENPENPKGKKSKRGRGGEKKKGKEPPKKKSRPGLTWADVAKHYICLITSANLDKMLAHDDYQHIEREVLKRLKTIPIEDYAKLRVLKSGVREGVIQIALEYGQGVGWYADNIPSFPPKKDGEPGYRFFKPGERPFRTFKAVVSEPEAADDLDGFVQILKGFNPFLREGYLSASKISTTKVLAIIRLRVGEELMDALAKEDFRVCYGLGTITLQPLAAGMMAEEPAEDMEM